MICRAEDHSNAAIALVLSPQFILENQAGQKWIRAASSPVFPIASASCRDLAGPAIEKPFSGPLRAPCTQFPPEQKWSYIVCATAGL